MLQADDVRRSDANSLYYVMYYAYSNWIDVTP